MSSKHRHCMHVPSLHCRSVLINSLAGDAAPAAADGPERLSTSATDKVKELQQSMEEGPDSKHTLEKFKTIGNRSLNRSLTNVRWASNDLNTATDVLLRLGA